MFGECHAHLAMDGINYKQAMMRHVKSPDVRHIRTCFEAYQAKGVTFVRDGGDAYGVSHCASHIASEYGIDYRTPIFAIHEQGNYGSIVGRPFTSMREYAALVDEADALGADFVEKYAVSKENEWDEYMSQVSDWELNRYLVKM